MIKIINQIKVSDRDLSVLEDRKNKLFDIKNEVHSDIFPPLVEGLKQIRELEQNIAIIAGAIASFTIPVVNTSFIQVKPLAYLALVCLFITICYAVYHLSEVMVKEVNGLAKLHTTYMGVIDKEIDRINSIIETGETEKLDQLDRESIMAELNEVKTTSQPDKSLNYLRTLLFIALGLLSLSFIPADWYAAIL